MDYNLLAARSRLIRSVRAFFDRRDYLETLTPLLSPDLIPETCLEVFKTAFLPPRNSARTAAKPYYLIPSPEIWMKKLIAVHKKSLYQICSSFRNCESTGLMHSPEFLMLEYYTMNADYLDSLKITEDLFDFLLSENRADLLQFQTEEALAELAPPFIRMTMDEAFVRYAGFSLNAAAANGTLRREAERLGLQIADGTSDADIYNLIFIHAVEPNLPQEKPAALLDYPALVPCLACLKKDVGAGTGGAARTAGTRGAAQAASGVGGGISRERWELYVRGIETANCYSEETDAEEVRRYFENEAVEKQKTAAVPHAIDGGYWRIFNTNGGFPRCSGAALGLDRLIMALCGKRTIDAVLPFPMR
ncbi:MAG: LysR family transcriptional regulator [Spirochaetaceae bacterium]|jgi:lysyl-tRNA synthetase class 2|nr:LysR family transcriptional regulator [Spirochaetaceae bacterium]